MLVQIANDTLSGLIDPLATGIDLDPLFGLMTAPHITKVFHAARQDIEIFYHKSGQVPSPDTKLLPWYAAMVIRLAMKPDDYNAR